MKMYYCNDTIKKNSSKVEVFIFTENIIHSIFLFGDNAFVAKVTQHLGFIVTCDLTFVVLHCEYVAGVLKNRRRFLCAQKARAYFTDNFFLKLWLLICPQRSIGIPSIGNETKLA
jgi:hypothetical protein